MSTSSTVAIVMLTVNQRETTLCALRSLGSNVADHVRVLLWDNGSTDGTVEVVRREFPELEVHHHPVNLGVASGRNAAAALAIERFQPTHLLFLDNDTVLTPGFVAALLQPFAANSRLGQTQAKLLYLDEPQRINDGVAVVSISGSGARIPSASRRSIAANASRSPPAWPAEARR